MNKEGFSTAHLYKTEYAERDAWEESSQNINSGRGRLYLPKMAPAIFSIPQALEGLFHFLIKRWSLGPSLEPGRF